MKKENISDNDLAGLSDPVRPSFFLPPGFPESWYGWMLSMELSFSLVEGACVHRDLYWEYSADTVTESVKKILSAGPLYSCFPAYRVRSVGDSVLFDWYASRPLYNHSKEIKIEHRTRIKSAYPWDSLDDDTVLCLWRDPEYPCGFRDRIMLRVGGRTDREASENWNMVARVIRKLIKEERRTTREQKPE